LANLSDCDKAGSLAIDPKVIKFLAQKTAETLVGDEDRWSLLTFVNGIANLAANITNKELIGAEGIIRSLFDILQVDPKKCTHGRVLTYLDESKATAATALWNLAYYEPNRHRMREVGGVEVLKELAGSILDERLRKNIKGTLWLLGVRDKSVTLHTIKNQNGKEPKPCSTDNQGAHVLLSYFHSNQDLAKKISVMLRKNGYKISSLRTEIVLLYVVNLALFIYFHLNKYGWIFTKLVVEQSRKYRWESTTQRLY
jgi:hypothetical protein